MVSDGPEVKRSTGPRCPRRCVTTIAVRLPSLLPRTLPSPSSLPLALIVTAITRHLRAARRQQGCYLPVECERVSSAGVDVG